MDIWSNHRYSKLQLLKLIHEISPSHVVISSMGLLTIYGPTLILNRSKLRFKIVFFCHSGIFTWSLRHLIMQAFCGASFGFVDSLIYVSRYTMNSWRHRFPWLYLKKSNVFPNSISLVPARSNKQIVPTKLRVGFLGRVSSEKDPVLFCQVAKAALTKSSRFEFHMYGSGDLHTQLTEQFSEYVTFHGATESNQALGQIDLLLVTSIVENCPFSVLEAKANGIPMVACPVGGIIEITEHVVDSIYAAKRTSECLITALDQAAECLHKLQIGCLINAARFDRTSAQPSLWKSILG